MSTNVVFTIGRQFGSGGRQVGKTLAQKLGIPFYDKELIAISARDSGLSEALFSNADEKATSSIFYSLVMGNYPMASGALGVTEMPLNDQLFLIQSKTIKRLASEGSCVIVGRCADYILRDMDNVVNVFIHADLKNRVERAIRVYEVPENKAEDVCLKTDKQRANFYNYYSDRKWGMCRTYDLSLDSGMLGIEGCAEQIIMFEKLYSAHKGQVI
ncbi:MULTISPECIES: cytidylate kinase-like family protein [Sphaerochaeta]|jgi:cytidylate kinase|uniref:Cytidylate kinase n=1 Tax=bioreactor metagenome TaxID=1076179 RepID=A0A644XY53_9ZZZZ|nr:MULTISPECIES: cytidylate kinase-like family protein [Sphaerochaeta]MDT3360251.1 cytidylate kinase-like family protein [Spirochaetota bacterium]MDD3423651.1 cytidylate kinase-like family protein [Sphaerochaeta sp.]MDD3456022.1 cytidylate kinase-like family protein [Sphaerochaeta sp.]MDD4037772.1 cytidylate kinase-like family protein [Sphaerochaeta sp.]MDD4449782.1 cytidylate kinase-like family protein [Sphaerochaeta sp.]